MIDWSYDNIIAPAANQVLWLSVAGGDVLATKVSGECNDERQGYENGAHDRIPWGAAVLVHHGSTAGEFEMLIFAIQFSV